MFEIFYILKLIIILDIKFGIFLFGPENNVFVFSVNENDLFNPKQKDVSLKGSIFSPVSKWPS